MSGKTEQKFLMVTSACQPSLLFSLLATLLQGDVLKMLLSPVSNLLWSYHNVQLCTTSPPLAGFCAHGPIDAVQAYSPGPHGLLIWAYKKKMLDFWKWKAAPPEQHPALAIKTTFCLCRGGYLKASWCSWLILSFCWQLEAARRFLFTWKRIPALSLNPEVSYKQRLTSN